MNCICGGFGCGVRMARNLKPFCRMETPAPTPRASNVFGTYSAAAEYARANGGKVRSATVSGGPKRFVVA